MASAPRPVIIIGAGVSGLLLAQYLRKSAIPYQIFERDADLDTRGIGWGLTLHWSLDALRSLLPSKVFNRLPEAYVDRAAVENGEASTFPFFDLSTGELKASTPQAPSSQRIRVTRDRLRRLLASDMDIQWQKSFKGYTIEKDGSIAADFEDGTSSVGSILVGCDGGHSRIRRSMFPDQHESHRLPVRVMGVRVQYTPAQIQPLRRLDPFFLQGANSANNTFAYFSMLDAPGNSTDGSDEYACQMCISWPFREGFFDQSSPMDFPETNEGRLELIRTFAGTWAEPFRSLALSIPPGTDIKTLELADWPPPKGLRGSGPVVLMGDAMHQMAMYRGEGANHAIVDVLDFANHVGPLLSARHLEANDKHRSSESAGDGNVGGGSAMRAALDKYEDAVVGRARPGVLASRRACMDAHDWSRISEKSPLLSRRAMQLDFDDDSLSW